MLHYFHFFIGFLVLLAPLVSSLPSGAPSCSINETAIAVGMSFENDPLLGYSLNVSRVIGHDSSWEIQVQSTTRNDYQGILMYISPSINPKVHLGTLSFKNQTKWKYQPLSLCQKSNVVSDSPNSTITHATPDRVLVSKNVTFKWTPCKYMNYSLADLVINAVVASQDACQSDGPAKWQRLRVSFPLVDECNQTLSSAPVETPSMFYATPATTLADPVATSTILPAYNYLPPNYPSNEAWTTPKATATASSIQESATTHTVQVGTPMLSYSPSSLENVQLGDSVMWIFSANQHTVTQSDGLKSCNAVDGGFDSGNQAFPSTFLQTFNQTGDFFYMCSVGQHCSFGMTGVVRVGSGNASAELNLTSSQPGVSIDYFRVLIMIMLLSF